MSEQAGVIAVRQCEELGMSRDAVYRLRKEGDWRAILPRVCISRAYPEGWRQRATAACCWRPDGALTAESAAFLLGLDDREPAAVELLLEGSPKRPAHWVRIHSTVELPETDRLSRGILKITTPERTLIEVAAHVPVFRLEAYLDATLRLGLSSLERVRDRIGELRTPGRANSAVLSDLIAQREGDRRPAESVLETLMNRRVRAGELPRPVKQFVVMDSGEFIARVDFAYPEQKLAIEVDSVSHHLGRTAFERDRARDARLMALGWRVLRFTYRQMKDEPDFVLSSIRAALTLSP